MPGKSSAAQVHRRHADGGRRTDDRGHRTDNAGREDEMGRQDDLDRDGTRSPDSSESHGRSAMSPGHLKKAAGEQSAREFAPGQVRKRSA